MSLEQKVNTSTPSTRWGRIIIYVVILVLLVVFLFLAVFLLIEEDVACVETGNTVADCGQSCGVAAATVTIPAQGNGTPCSGDYSCLPGDGACPEDVDCVETGNTAADCGQSCGVAAATVTIPAQGNGTPCSGDYTCLPGDGDCPPHSCITPTVTTGYDLTGTTEEDLSIANFNVTGVTCDAGYSGTSPYASVCATTGLPYILNDCTETPQEYSVDSTGTCYSAYGTGANIGLWVTGSVDDARDACNINDACLGFSYSDATGSYRLQEFIGGATAQTGYSCYRKI